ncbi:hypothetical protein POTOM_031135 [Populus tomentosa]|uniref:Phosphoribosylformylglycinamidine synthase n=1 Tax=Populus tomentosa TaxID=118781 RepID=A0A8X8CS88_POPTO|nr:hypothetical protein POTOM_031135 [Populus tomentosa]
MSSDVSLEQWFFSHFQLLEEDILLRMAVTVWSIWIHRSDRLWNNGSMPSHIAVKTGLDFLNIWTGAQTKSTTPSRQHSLHNWEKPPLGFLKCNVDAAISNNVAGMAYGSWFFAQGWHWYCLLAWLLANTGSAFEPRMVEALALTGVLEKLHTSGFNNIIVESDAKALVDGIASTKLAHPDIFECGLVLQDCRRLIDGSATIKIVHVSRNACSIAHFLANLSFDFMSDVSWSHTPDFLCTVLSAQALSQPANCSSRSSVMAGAREITAATEFLLGNNRKTLYAQRDLPINRRNQLLLGMLRGHRPAFGVSNKRSVSLRCRAQSKPKTLVSRGVTSSVDEQSISNKIVGLRTEQCFNIGIRSGISSQKLGVLRWLLQETYEPENLGTESFLEKKMKEGVNAVKVEAGPRLSFTTAWSANAVSICHACGLTEVTRLERSRSVVPEEVRYVPVMERGRKALEEINQEMGLAFDEQDLQYYTSLFREDIKRNPTTVELFDIAQSNRKHSRHWFFTGKIIIDGQSINRTLMQIVKSTLQANPNNYVIGFKDNSSAIKGFSVKQLRPVQPGSTCPLNASNRDLDILFTAETHNFPCAVAPHPGAETGAGGRIRDTHATGRGSFVVASTAGYCVGNLNVERSYAPWEDHSFTYPSNLASPLQVLIDASNGASDYGNNFGEPLIQGYTRTFGMRLPSGERREWLKPIMFSGGIGQIDHTHITKGEPDVGMLVVKIGGPAY